MKVEKKTDRDSKRRLETREDDKKKVEKTAQFVLAKIMASKINVNNFYKSMKLSEVQHAKLPSLKRHVF